MFKHTSTDTVLQGVIKTCLLEYVSILRRKGKRGGMGDRILLSYSENVYSAFSKPWLRYRQVPAEFIGVCNHFSVHLTSTLQYRNNNYDLPCETVVKVIGIMQEQCLEDSESTI